MKSTKNPIMDPKKFTESLDTLMNYFENDEKCLDYIVETKYKNGWRCTKCGSKKYYLIKKRNIIRCSKCKHEKSFMADTIFGYTKLPLRQWFRNIYILATQEKGMSAMQVYKQLGLKSYQTAWDWLHKIRKELGKLERSKLSGEIEVGEILLDVCYEDIEYENARFFKKVIVVCAVEMKYDKKGQPALRKIKLRHVPDDSKKSMHSFIINNIEKNSTVKTSGFEGYKGIENLGYIHNPIIIYSAREGEIKFPRVKMIKINVKQWLGRTHRYVSVNFLQDYLNEYVYRFNRRGNKAKAFTDIMEFVILGKDRNK
ncbi:IS1595 family transposase ISEba1 [subsurface metagenome]